MALQGPAGLELIRIKFRRSGVSAGRRGLAKEGGRVLRTERYFGGMYRSFSLPAELDEANSTAKYHNGVLELTLAKKPVVAGRKLAVQ